MPGPPPKPDAERRRRNAVPGSVRLPSQGRTKQAPKWPLLPDIVLKTKAELAVAKAERLAYELGEANPDSDRAHTLERRLEAAQERAAIHAAQVREQRALETTLWRDLWHTPQAAEWERLRWTRDVAQYVRHKVLAELGDLDAAKEARQWTDRLGLTPMSLLRLRWTIAADEVAEQRAARAAAPAAPTTPRTRLRVVDPGAVAGA
jgi:hypothetical protein